MADDDFSRSDSSGWGHAQTGGNYKYSGQIAAFSVTSNKGVVAALKPGKSAGAYLPGVKALDTLVQNTVTVPSVDVSQVRFHATVEARRQSDSSGYRGRLQVRPGGAVQVAISRTNGKAETGLASAFLPLTVEAGQNVYLQLQVTGTNPVALKVRAWGAGSAAPAWQATVEDATAKRVTASGTVGIWDYVSSSSVPLTIEHDGFRVVRLVPTQAPEPAPAPSPIAPAPAPTVAPTTSKAAAPTTTSAAPTPTSSSAPTTSSVAPTTTKAAPTTSSAAPTTSTAAPTTTKAAPTTSSVAPKPIAPTTSAAPTTTPPTTAPPTTAPPTSSAPAPAPAPPAPAPAPTSSSAAPTTPAPAPAPAPAPPAPAPAPAPTGQTYMAATFDGMPSGAVKATSFIAALGGTNKNDSGYDDMSVVGDNRGSGKVLRTTLKAWTIHSPNDAGNNLFIKLPTQVDSACIKYDIRFDSNFDWSLGGKLPGLEGVAPGVTPATPSGGNSTDLGWSGRMMWVGPKAYSWAGPTNMAVSYMYHPGQEGKYGDNLKWYRAFQPGSWHTVKQCYTMNTVGKADGRLTTWYDGVKIFDNTAFKFRTRNDVHISHIMFSLFRGGATQDWAGSRDSYVDIDNLSVTSS